MGRRAVLRAMDKHEDKTKSMRKAKQKDVISDRMRARAHERVIKQVAEKSGARDVGGIISSFVGGPKRGVHKEKVLTRRKEYHKELKREQAEFQSFLRRSSEAFESRQRIRDSRREELDIQHRNEQIPPPPKFSRPNPAGWISRR